MATLSESKGKSQMKMDMIRMRMKSFAYQSKQNGLKQNSDEEVDDSQLFKCRNKEN